MMLDEKTRQQIMALADGALSAEERERIEKIVAENAEARDFLGEMRRLDSALRDISPAEPDEAEWASVWRRVRARTSSAPKRRILRPRWAVVLAAAAVALLVFSITLRWLAPGPGVKGPPTRAVDANNGDVYGATTEILADSHTIILDFPEESGTIIWTVTEDSPAVPVAL